MDQDIKEIHDNLGIIRDDLQAQLNPLIDQMEALKALSQMLGTDKANSKVPDQNTAIGTRVRFRDEDSEDWTEGYFTYHNPQKERYPFGVIFKEEDGDFSSSIFNECEIIED